MGKKLSKSDLAFNRNVKNKIDSDSKEKLPSPWSDSNPIFIPKRKKRK